MSNKKRGVSGVEETQGRRGEVRLMVCYREIGKGGGLSVQEVGGGGEKLRGGKFGVYVELRKAIRNASQ